MIHQPLGGAQGQATEIEIAANHILKHVKNKTAFYQSVLVKVLKNTKRYRS